MTKIKNDVEIRCLCEGVDGVQYISWIPKDAALIGVNVYIYGVAATIVKILGETRCVLSGDKNAR